MIWLFMKEPDKASSPTTARPSASSLGTHNSTSTAASSGSPRRNIDKAIADYNEAIRLDPKNGTGLHQPRQHLDRQEGI